MRQSCTRPWRSILLGKLHWWLALEKVCQLLSSATLVTSRTFNSFSPPYRTLYGCIELLNEFYLPRLQRDSSNIFPCSQWSWNHRHEAFRFTLNFWYVENLVVTDLNEMTKYRNWKVGYAVVLVLIRTSCCSSVYMNMSGDYLILRKEAMISPVLFFDICPLRVNTISLSL